MLNTFSNKKDPTLLECEKIEADKKELIRLATEEIASLRAKSGNLLERMSDGDQAAKSDLQKNRARIAELEDEIQAHNVALEKIPLLKDRAWGIEIEKLIPEIEKLDAQFSTFVADINKKAAVLISANNKFLEFLDGFGELGATQSLGLRGDFLELGLGDLSSYGSSPLAASSDKSINLAIVLMAAIYDKDRFVAWVEKTRSSIAERISRMRDHALRLKGENLPSPAWPYCPSCYKMTRYAGVNGKAHCSECGKDVVPVY